MRPRNFLIALPLAALAIAGCGGGGGDSTASTPSVTTTPTTASLSKAELITQGDAICAEVNAAVGATGSASSSGSSSQVGQVADIYTGMVNSLKGLGTPEGGGNSEFISAAEELSTAEGEAKLADERGDSSALSEAETSATSAIVSFQSAAQAFGFEECSEGPSAPTASGPGRRPREEEGGVEHARPKRRRSRNGARRGGRRKKRRRRNRRAAAAAPKAAPARRRHRRRGRRHRRQAAPADSAARWTASAERLSLAGSGGRGLRPGAVEARVGAARLDQLVVGALLGDPAAFEDDDLAGAADRREAVGDDDRGAALQQPLQALLDRLLGAHVDVGGRLVEDQDARLGQQRPGEGDELALAGRELDAALADLGLDPVRQRGDELGWRRPSRPPPRSPRGSPPGRPKAMFSRTLPEKRKPSWGTIPSWRRSARCWTPRRSWPSTSTRPCCGS